MASFFTSKNDASEKAGKINVSDLMLIMESNGIKIDKEGLDKIAELGGSGEIAKTDLIKLFNSSQNWRNELELTNRKNMEANNEAERTESKNMEKAEASWKPFSKKEKNMEKAESFSNPLSRKQDSGYQSVDVADYELD